MRAVDVRRELVEEGANNVRNITRLYQRSAHLLTAIPIRPDGFANPLCAEGLSNQRSFELYSALSHPPGRPSARAAVTDGGSVIAIGQAAARSELLSTRLGPRSNLSPRPMLVRACCRRQNPSFVFACTHIQRHRHLVNTGRPVSTDLQPPSHVVDSLRAVIGQCAPP